MKFFWMALGGAAGTVCRYLVTSASLSFTLSAFPAGTLLINLSGSLLIGLLWGWSQEASFSPAMTAFLFIGLLGGYTTFSTFSLENIQLLRSGEIRMAVIYTLVSSLGGPAAAFAGLRLSGHTLLG
jgi:CrcB protein